jgi:hypothetical protein
MEYSFGKVPDKLETNPLGDRKTLILHYEHEFKRLQETGTDLTSVLREVDDKGRRY